MAVILEEAAGTIVSAAPFFLPAVLKIA